MALRLLVILGLVGCARGQACTVALDLTGTDVLDPTGSCADGATLADGAACELRCPDDVLVEDDPQRTHDLNGDGTVDLRPGWGAMRPWLFEGVQPSCTGGVFDAGSVTCTACPIVANAQRYDCFRREHPDTGESLILNEGAQCPAGTYRTIGVFRGEALPK